jgi:hypothetical protein
VREFISLCHDITFINEAALFQPNFERTKWILSCRYKVWQYLPGIRWRGHGSRHACVPPHRQAKLNKRI